MDMDELKYKVFDDGELVNEVTIKKIKPCIASEGKIRVLMQLDADLEDIIPVLVSKYPPGRVNYIERKNVLTLNIFNRLITIYPSGKISMNKTHDKEEAVKVITNIMNDINTCYSDLEQGNSINYEKLKEKLSKIGPLVIYNCLPQTNCEECGEVTCMAFAMKLLSGDTTLEACLPLNEKSSSDKIKCLRELLGDQIMETVGWKKKNK
ncbi:MAG: (Fe-S)-binding protein [Methanobacteriaceae archaeon]|nr:(Fe-S)-binding protein [Methanobacteriaceae archaeon]